MKSTRLVIVALSVVLAVAGGWWLLRARSTEVELVSPRRGEAVALVYATGFVEAEATVTVASRLTAPVARVLAEEGERVTAGEALAILEASEQRASAAQAAATARGAALQAERTLQLAEQGWVSKAARDRAVAELRAARAAAEAAAARAGQTVIRAGIDGVILKRDVEPGDLALPSRPLFLLGDPARLRVTATIDERDVPRIAVGQTALMSSDAYPGRVFRGQVREITPGGDPVQRAFRVRLSLDGVAPPIGLTLEVNIITSRAKDALLVPPSTIRDGQVWLVADGRATPRAVMSGIKGSEAVQLVAGLSFSERIIANPPEGLKAGDRVRVVE